VAVGSLAALLRHGQWRTIHRHGNMKTTEFRIGEAELSWIVKREYWVYLFLTEAVLIGSFSTRIPTCTDVWPFTATGSPPHRSHSVQVAAVWCVLQQMHSVCGHLRKTFAAKRGKDEGGFRKLHGEMYHDLNCLRNIERAMK
jgi:hypothetical protein